jgi:hypothetical protein
LRKKNKYILGKDHPSIKYQYYKQDTSAAARFVPEGIIRPVVGVSHSAARFVPEGIIRPVVGVSHWHCLLNIFII